jgi:dTDP-4-dehydrorhamnose reductase
MKIHLFGSRGMLGSYIFFYLKNKIEINCVSKSHFNIATNSQENLNEFLHKIVKEGDIIINAAAITKPEKFKKIELYKVNGIFPNWLASFKKNFDCQIINISSDGVFKGDKGSYSENDPPDSENDYGISKFIGENNLNTNIRTSIIGEEIYNKKNFLEWLILNKNKEVNGYTNHLWNGVTCLELCKLIEHIVIYNEFWLGTKHVFSPQTLNKLELIKLINSIFKLNLTVNPSIDEFDCNRELKTKFKPLITTSIRNQIEEIKAFNIKQYD